MTQSHVKPQSTLDAVVETMPLCEESENRQGNGSIQGVAECMSEYMPHLDGLQTYPDFGKTKI
jgi:hypothetical protein